MIFVTNHEILEKAKQIFPDFFKRDYMWFPLKKNSVRVRFVCMNTDVYAKTEFVFTYFEADRWSFETYKNYMKKHKGDKKGE